MDWREFQRLQHRRDFLRSAANGVGVWALGDLLSASGLAADSADAVSPLAAKAPHFAPKAKHVIYMFMEGGPSQYELFDPKPGLAKYDGQPLPESLTKDLKLAFIKPTAKVMASRYPFHPHGQSGME
jgi:hypothetical protein